MNNSIFVPLLFPVLCLCALAFAADKQNRAKRFAAFGSLSTVGGRVGCVVSQNKLFINGHFTKDLSEDEQEELKQYREALDTFKQDVKVYLEERQKQFRAQVSRQSADDASIKSGTSAQPKKPEPPKKPSFCSDKATTQYVFDGCSVQGDSVFVGDTFVRKLTPAEQKELENFDRQFTAYQKAVTAGFRKQVEEIFGQHFGSLFGANEAAASGETGANKGAEVAPQQTESGVNGTVPLEAPKTPNFCTLVV